MEAPHMADSGKTVRDIMNKEPLMVDKNKPLMEVVKIMADKNIGAVIITDGGKPAGIFSERDLLKKVISQGIDPTQTAIGAVATLKLTGIKASSNVETCAREMYRLNLRHFPVSEDGKIVGILSIRDIVGALINPGWSLVGNFLPEPGDPYREASTALCGRFEQSGERPHLSHAARALMFLTRTEKSTLIIWAHGGRSF